MLLGMTGSTEPDDVEWALIGPVVRRWIGTGAPLTPFRFDQSTHLDRPLHQSVGKLLIRFLLTPALPRNPWSTGGTVISYLSIHQSYIAYYLGTSSPWAILTPATKLYTCR